MGRDGPLEAAGQKAVPSEHEARGHPDTGKSQVMSWMLKAPRPVGEVLEKEEGTS